MDEKIKAESFLRAQGYTSIKGKFPREFTWQPDLLVKRKGELFAFLLRKTDDIPEVFVQRISKTRVSKNKTHIGIIFCKKPKNNSVRLVGLYGIGVLYLHGNNLIEISRPRLGLGHKVVAKKIEIEKPKKMPRTDIFISSHQIIKERSIAKKIIDKLRNDHQFPIFAILVEKDSRYPIDKTKECIKENMAKAEMFVGIIGEQYRPVVSYEVKRAFNTEFKSNKNDKILIFIKNLRVRHAFDTELIKWIEKRKTVKYIPYTDERDFDSVFNNALMIKIRKIHKKLGIPFLE